MKPVAKIKPDGLLAAKQVRRIFDILQEDKKPAQILFVGGCVRNAFLGAEVNDVDLATIWTPYQVTEKLKSAGVKVIPTGIDHGTVTAVLDAIPVQITTLRCDVDTDGRHAKIAYTDSWREDAKRRDFTMNTLLADIKGNIFDPLGSGLADLKKRKVIFVGDPKIRIQEDYLRILRFFRFHAWYGKGRADAKALAACKAASRNLKSLSKERVTQEVLKICISRSAGDTFKLMREYGILTSIVSARFNANYFNQLNKLENINFETIGLIIMSDFSKAGAARIKDKLRLPNQKIKQIDEVISASKRLKIISCEEIRILLYKMGHETAELILIAKLLKDNEPSTRIKKWIHVLRAMERPVIPLRGQDLINQGMKPGPGIKKALEKFERSWIRKGFTV